VKQVWYHGNCYDGFGAAWAASKFLGRDGVLYKSVSYGYPPPEFSPDDDLYIVDFSFPRETLLELKEKAKSVLVLDHHKTAEEALRGLDFCVFDMERSGAGLTWDYLSSGKERPTLINLIEDRDLWRFKVEGSKPFHSFILSQPFDFEVWDQIANQLHGDSAWALYEKGQTLLDAESQLVAKIVKKSWLGEIDGHKVALCNIASHWSEIGEKLCETYPDAAFGASFTVLPDLTVMWSLRSRNGFDVSAVAKKYGGGGHAAAAGFKANIESINQFGKSPNQEV
jgi:oligoribonuclease NrnB/cAMP/cGMP phosphodiesterase (DHH superfamily)